MSDGQRMRDPERRQLAAFEEPEGGHLAEASAEVRQHLDDAADVLARLTSGDAQEFLSRARQRGGE